MNKNACPPRARGCFAIYAQTAQLVVAIYEDTAAARRGDHAMTRVPVAETMP